MRNGWHFAASLEWPAPQSPPGQADSAGTGLKV